jgi:hypothetical protein
VLFPLLAALSLASSPNPGDLAGNPAADSARCRPGERVTILERRVNWNPVPFVMGERLQYDVSFGHLHVGSGEMRLVGRDTVRGRPMWTAQLAISGGFAMLSVHDTSESWFDSVTFNTFRFVENLHEPRYHANRDTQIYPERQVFQRRGKTEQPSVSDPMDDVSLVYFVRTLALEPGQCYVLRRYYMPQGNPLVLHVTRREHVTVPAGTFNAIVVHPEITTGGIFSQNGRAELWLADDSTRAVVQLKTQLPFGSINLYLTHVIEPPGG